MKTIENKLRKKGCPDKLIKIYAKMILKDCERFGKSVDDVEFLN